MLKEKIPSFPFYILLIPLFYVWHKTNDYWGLIPVGISLRILGEYLLIGTVIFAAGFVIMRRIRAAAAWTAFLIAIYLFWGSLHDFLKSISPAAFFSSYSFLLSLILVIAIAILIYQVRKKPALLNWSRYMNVLLLLLTTIELFTSAIYAATNRSGKSMIDYGLQPPALTGPADAADSLPDIFVIIFDEYLSTQGLKEYLDFDNSKLDSSLGSRNFYVAGNSKSNYNSTPHSIASLFNMNYFPASLEWASTEPKALLQGQKALKRAFLPRLLTEQGYEIFNFGSMDIYGADAPFEPFFNRDRITAFRFENLWYRVYYQIWWNFTQRMPWLKPDNSAWIKDQDRRIHIFSSNFSNLMKAISESGSKPRFVFAHFLLPHPPYNFDANGNRREWGSLDRTSHEDSLYIDQLQFTNKLIDSIANHGTEVPGRKRIILLLGDHGYRDNSLHPSKRDRDKQFMNLTAYYFNDHNYDMLYKSISPVNSFRIILNKYFDAGLPLLKDSTIMLH